MNILITNDDSFKANGIHVLAKIMCQFGRVTVIAPKRPQSGMSMALSLGQTAMAYKKLPQETDGTWAYLDGTPASCIKYGFNFQFKDIHPDVVVCGINHGSNAASAACYSGTLGAAEEAALNGVPAIGVSVDDNEPDADFSSVERYFPEIFEKLMSNLPERYGIFYNINFPAIPAGSVKGIKVGCQGMGKWIKEFKDFNQKSHSVIADREPGEVLYSMVGEFVDAPENTSEADHHILSERFISIVPEHLDRTDQTERQRLNQLQFNQIF